MEQSPALVKHEPQRTVKVCAMSRAPFGLGFVRRAALPTAMSPIARALFLSPALALLGLLSSCRSPLAENPSIGRLRLIGEQRIAARSVQFAGTTVGGLSGLDYSAARNEFVAISDDKNEGGPARFYTLRLDYDAQAFRSATVTAMTELRATDGAAYVSRADARAGKGEVPDLESIRFDPRDGSLWYTSEGDGELGLQPFVRHLAPDGRPLGELPTPPMFRFDPTHQRGLRHNLVFEGLSPEPDGAAWWIGTEGPLIEDGPVPDEKHGALVRFSRVDRAGKLLRQIAYPVAPLPGVPVPGKFADIGVPEILALDDHRLLVLERASLQGADSVSRFYVKLYFVETREATDVGALASLREAPVVPARKTLLLDCDKLGLESVDNLEGLAWGRRLPNGHATLVLVSDDNFSRREVTQLLVFEVLPR